MNYSEFESRPVEQFHRMLHNRANFWLLQHIPKTAGSSLVESLCTLISPFYNIYIHPEVAHKSPDEAIDEDTQNFLVRHTQTRFNFATGHIRLRNIRAIRKHIPETRLFTFLRDPVERTISEYRYMCTPTHPGSDDHLRRYPTIEHWIEDPKNGNTMSAFAATEEIVGDQTANQIVSYMKNEFVFIGTVANFEICFQYLTALMFFPVKPLRQRVNATADTENNAIEIPDSFRQRVADKNALDVQVYTIFAQQIASRRSEIEDFVSSLSR